MFSSGRIQGYVLRITESVDKQGFPIKQCILTNGRVVVQSQGSWGAEVQEVLASHTVLDCRVTWND